MRKYIVYKNEEGFIVINKTGDEPYPYYTDNINEAAEAYLSDWLTLIKQGVIFGDITLLEKP